ncbi:MAG: hypothetical protein EZS28_017883 [Streblomastix strix]|uniref:Uncharacterized protein n=1 Tax=Streblomastix strix TaxID=222440 RepID=A0A5J4VVS5_9EUKA|nr:MAG: hypothetical protein EZS28_017883 [Streblomastix strix]
MAISNYSGIARVPITLSYPNRLKKSVSVFIAPSFIRVGSPIGTVALRLFELINKLFPQNALLPVKQLAQVKSYVNSHPAYISRYIARPSPESVGTVQHVKVVLSVPVISILPDLLLNVPFITPPFPFAMVFQIFVNMHPSILRFPVIEQDINDPSQRVIPIAENEFSAVFPELIYIILSVSIVTVVIYPLVNDNVPTSYLIRLPLLFVKLSILESVILTFPNVTYISLLEIVAVSQ